MLEQDQSLELQRSRERLGEIADLALAQLSRSLGDWELGLHELNAFPPSPTIRARFPKGATFILISRDGIKVYPQRPLLFTPAPPVVHAQTPGAFDVADELELREQQYDRAIAALKPLTLRPATRPEALLRIARIQNKSDRQEDALNTYKSLASETAPDPSETLFALLAASARCRILMNLGRRQEASTEADALRAGLLDGRWPLSHEAFDYRWSELDRLGIAAGSPPKDAIDFSTLVAEVYNRWQIAQSSGTSPSGRESRRDSSLLIWNSNPNGLSALLTLPDWLDASLKLPPNSADVHWKLLLPGTSGGTGLTVTRSMADAQIP
jgi:tetratricopeptide (TPR) repeat protein